MFLNIHDYPYNINLNLSREYLQYLVRKMIPICTENIKTSLISNVYKAPSINNSKPLFECQFQINNQETKFRIFAIT